MVSPVLQARKATVKDIPALSGTLAEAFFDDPVFGWAMHDDRRRREILPGFFRIINEANLPHGGSTRLRTSCRVPSGYRLGSRTTPGR